jgi:hypothetical protein
MGLELILKKDLEAKRMINSFRENMEWIAKNLEEVRKRYPDEFVFVDKSEVKAHGKDLKETAKTLEKQYGDVRHFGFQFVPKQPISLVL